LNTPIGGTEEILRSEFVSDAGTVGYRISSYAAAATSVHTLARPINPIRLNHARVSSLAIWRHPGL
jgi:hypothetical protein